MKENINVYYPVGTDKIIHFGKNGNQYRLDAIDIPVKIIKKIKQDSRFKVVNVNESDDSVLEPTHSHQLITSYRLGTPLELSESSGLMWQKDFYPWIVNKSWATILGAKNALINSRSFIATSGGHHSEHEHGRGFGPISNMIIAANYLLNQNLIGKIAILDLDVHFANGTHSLVKNEKRILSCDIWKYKLPKWKYTPNSNNIHHKKVTNIHDYQVALDAMFHKITKFRPDLLFVYNGLDPLQKDRMGGILGFDDKYLLERNKQVCEFINRHHLAVCVFIGGGYIDYSKSQKEIEESKNNLVSLFVKSTATIFGI